MRQLDDKPLDPEVVSALDAIDATLAGDPVDPEHAESAELALLLVAERPVPRAEFSRSLDQRVASRFSPGPIAARTRSGLRWPFVPAIGLAAAALVAVVLAASSGGGSGPSSVSGGEKAASLSGRSSTARTAASSASKASAQRASGSPAFRSRAAAAPLAPSTPSSVSPYPGLNLPSNGRKVVQSSQLSLIAPSNRIDDVAQQVFNVVGAQKGFVNSSTVTAAGGPNGYAQFQLSVPSATLPQTMTQLSELRYASVASRTDNSSDVTNQFNGANRALGQAQALRTSLLKQLQNAVTETQISSLQAQLKDANARISNTQATLRSLNHEVSYSTISLTVEGTTGSAPTHGAGGGFTIGKAAHDAGRVLTVAAGVALIALAVLVPVGLLAALGWWIGAALRRRRREQALDLA